VGQDGILQADWQSALPQFLAARGFPDRGPLPAGSAVSGAGRGSWLKQQSDLNGIALDAGQHPAEYKVMEREHRVPVDQTEQPAGPEQSGLVEDALALVLWFDSEFEQRLAR
jgi:hypothetical protein